MLHGKRKLPGYTQWTFDSHSLSLIKVITKKFHDCHCKLWVLLFKPVITLQFTNRLHM